MRSPLLPRRHRERSTREETRSIAAGLVSFVLFSFYQAGRHISPGGESITQHPSRPREKEDFLISIRIAGGPIVHNQFNDIWQVRSRTEGMKHREEENTSSNRPRPSSNRISPSHSLAATFGRQCQDPPICCLSLSLSPSLRHVRDERPPTSPLTSLLWHLLVCMKNHSGRRAATRQDSFASISISSTTATPRMNPGGDEGRCAGGRVDGRPGGQAKPINSAEDDDDFIAFEGPTLNLAPRREMEPGRQEAGNPGRFTIIMSCSGEMKSKLECARAVSPPHPTTHAHARWPRRPFWARPGRLP